MDIHFFQEVCCLAVVSRDSLFFVRSTGVHRHMISKDFDSIDCVSFDDFNCRVAISCKRMVEVISVPRDNETAKEIFALLERNCATMTWNATGDVLLAGDKSGGVWLISTELESNLSPAITEKSLVPVSLCSRIAVVLALNICGDKQSKYLAVGDRDGRLSIFHYPATHNLHRVCLGHSQYIAALTGLDAKNYPFHIISLGGDGVVCLWNVITGECCSRVEMFEHDSVIETNDRPKCLLFSGITKAGCQCSKYTWLVFGEESSTINSFSLIAHSSGCKVKCDSNATFQLKRENLSDLTDPFVIAAPVCGATVVRSDNSSSLILAIGNQEKSCWPWLCLKFDQGRKTGSSDCLGPALIKELNDFFQADDSTCSFSVRQPRRWLERHPHQHIAAYFAKRKKKGEQNSDAVSVSSSSSDEANL